jgi:transcription elongation factor GreA
MRCEGEVDEMTEKEVLLTAEGLEKLEAELEHLKTVKRREVAQRIKAATEFGDLSENSEYDDAKNEQAFIEGRILTLEKQLRNAKIIETEGLSADRVSVGSSVLLRDMETQEEVEYKIVGSVEANPLEMKISNESPVGKSLLGRTSGECIEVNAPRGTLQYEIVQIR